MPACPRTSSSSAPPPNPFRSEAINEPETQRLARLYERNYSLLVALKQSLLHKTFTGEL